MAWTVGAVLTAAQMNAYVMLESTTWASPVSSGITEGNGTTSASYLRIGGMVRASYRFVLGSTSAITGDIILTLPVAAAFARQVRGGGWFEDVSASSRLSAQAFSISGTTTCTIRPVVASGTYDSIATAASATVPFTWATSDIINIDIDYPAG